MDWAFIDDDKFLNQIRFVDDIVMCTQTATTTTRCNARNSLPGKKKSK